jgi:hypothetical protein
MLHRPVVTDEIDAEDAARAPVRAPDRLASRSFTLEGRP